MSAQLICKVIRILETLISIILMNLHGGLVFFSASVKKRNTGFVDFWEKLGWESGEEAGLLRDSLTFGVTGVIQS